MLEAGLEHGVAAEAIQKLDAIPTGRQAITNAINGHYSSARIQERLVELLQQAFRQAGEEKKAETITLAYLGWEPTPHQSGRAREDFQAIA
jgi:hypothetical protein